MRSTLNGQAESFNFPDCIISQKFTDSRTTGLSTHLNHLARVEHSIRIRKKSPQERKLILVYVLNVLPVKPALTAQHDLA